MELGITRSRRVMGEGGGDDAVGVHLERSASPGPGEGGVVFQETQRRPHSAVVGRPDLRRRLSVPERAD